MKRAYKIVFLGNTSVGKTTLISQYLYHKVQSPTPTIGIDFLSTTFEINGRAVRLQLWDTAGQERFQSIIGNYTRNTFIAVIVYAADDQNSLEKLKMWVDGFVLTHNRREDVKLLFVANKRDLAERSFDPEFAQGRALAEEMGARFIATNALESSGISELSVAINDFISENLEQSEQEETETNAIAAAPRRGCC